MAEYTWILTVKMDMLITEVYFYATLVECLKTLTMCQRVKVA